MTINKKDANADDNQGPSVESENMDERIEARRTRIKKKNELNEKKKKGIKSAIETEKKKELSKSRKQIQDSLQIFAWLRIRGSTSGGQRRRRMLVYGKSGSSKRLRLPMRSSRRL